MKQNKIRSLIKLCISLVPAAMSCALVTPYVVSDPGLAVAIAWVYVTTVMRLVASGFWGYQVACGRIDNLNDEL